MHFNPWITFVGCAGGLLPDVLRLIKNRYDEKLPAYIKKPTFWVGIALLFVLGGLVTWLLDITEIKEALLVGYAAPDILSKLVTKTTEQATGPSPKALLRASKEPVKFKLMNWWAR
jgi:hypothetical protein